MTASPPAGTRQTEWHRSELGVGKDGKGERSRTDLLLSLEMTLSTSSTDNNNVTATPPCSYNKVCLTVALFTS